MWYDNEESTNDVCVNQHLTSNSIEIQVEMV